MAKAIMRRLRPRVIWAGRPRSLSLVFEGKMPQAWQVSAAMLGIAGPVALGSLAGQPGMGIASSLGGLAMSGALGGQSLREQAKAMVYTMTAGGLAMLIGSGMAGRGALASFGIPLLAALAGILGGISRPMVRASIQFMLYTVIAANIGTRGAHPLALLFFFCLGTTWTAGLALVLKPLFAVLLPGAAPAVPPPAPGYSATQLLRRWRGTLRHLAGWRYTIQITLCLAAAQVAQWLWPHPRAYWVSLTVVLVIQRGPRPALARIFHRAAGTAAGVALASLFLLGTPPFWALIAFIAALAAARHALLQVHYAAYTAVVTPLIILLLDFGQDVSWPVIAVRLAATLAGCAFALAFGYLLWSGPFSPSQKTLA